ncbi:MAG TPA: hypothetical protein VG963_06580 [Polyangiaceae bacterium]|nr:hypothetical protein [Polyangiaceae bacterium]
MSTGSARHWRRKLLGWLGGSPAPIESLFQRRREALVSARLLVRVFYAVVLYQVSDAAILDQFLGAKVLDPLWCVRWARLVGPALAGSLVYAVSLVGALACALVPERRAPRIVLAVALLELGGLANSFGKINHNWHALCICAFLLCFVPTGGLDRIRRSSTRVQAYLLGVWSLLASFFLTYSISGVWKVAVGVVQAASLKPTAFSPAALAYHVSRRLLETGETTRLARILLDHPALGWPCNLLTLYLETFAFVAAFRPRLHRVWAFGLICFHLGSGLVLGIGFYHHVLLLGVLGLASPFAPARLDARALLLDLPLFGDLARWLRDRRQRLPERDGLAHRPA